MSYVDAIVLGLVQGITEFLPISSSGHLVLMREVLDVETVHALAIDASLHFATALAVLLYFREDIWRLILAVLGWVRGVVPVATDRILIFALVLGTIPTALAGVLFEDRIDAVFKSATAVAWILIASAVFFLFAEHVYKRNSERKELSVSKGVGIGLFQVLALLPGMSRSGATLGGGMLLGLTRENAARFSFLLSFPIILGVGIMKLLSLSESIDFTRTEWGALGVGMLLSFVTGVLTIHYFLRYLRKHTLVPFAIYCAGLGMLTFALIA
jgi:undecaprenyl-diphosphatase